MFEVDVKNVTEKKEEEHSSGLGSDVFKEHPDPRNGVNDENHAIMRRKCHGFWCPQVVSQDMRGCLMLLHFLVEQYIMTQYSTVQYFRNR